MQQSFPEVANLSPVSSKSQHRIELSASVIVNIFFIVGMCQYSKRPSALHTPSTLALDFPDGLHLEKVPILPDASHR